VTDRQQLTPRVLVPGTAVVVLVTVGLAVPALARAHNAFQSVAAVADAVALLCAAALVLLSFAPTPTALLRRWAGIGLGIWALGQLGQAIIEAGAASTTGRPRLADVVTVVGALLAVGGGLTAPLQASEWHPRMRLGVDAAVLGVTIGLLAWRFVYRGLLDNHAVPVAMAPQVLTVVLLLTDVILACVAVLAAIRDLDRALAVTAAGVLLYVLGHAVLLRTGLMEAARPGWQLASALLWVVAWPLVLAGLLRYRPPAGRPPDRTSAAVDPDARVVAFTSLTSLILLAVGVVAIIGTHAKEADDVSLWLVLSAVVVFGLRELFNARQRAILLRRLHEEATVDPLTGLANRRVLAETLSQTTAEEPWCLLVVDIDGFKEFNDLLGHTAGDRLLRSVSHRLSSVLPPRAVLSRVGGDEFAVLSPGGRASGLELAQRLVAAVRLAGGDVDGTALIPVSASVGVADVQGARQALAARGDQDADQLLAPLSAAGAAQRMASSTGHNRVELFDGPVARMWQRRLSVEQRLRTAIKSGAFDVHFQPIVDLNRLEVTGAEALARWRDEELGSVDPAEFIPVAEETGLVVALGELILRQTLDEAVAAGLIARGLRLSCNVSPMQLRVPGFHRVVEQVLAAHDIPPELMVVEVTEAVLVEEEGQAVRTLGWLADAGITIAIDDFGTGYSALGYLRRLPAHMLKVDKSLTASLEDEPRAMAITKAVIELGASIGVAIVVEGIETTSVAELVTGMGAGYGQGSLFGRPMTAEDLAGTCDRIRAIARPA
jgi:diguanylate cyclase (GGDEF)-like protein